MKTKSLADITDDDCLGFAEKLGGVSHLSKTTQIHQVKELLAKIHNGVTNISGYMDLRICGLWNTTCRKIE